MKKLGEFLQLLPPIKMALGFLALFGSFVLVVATTLTTQMGIPKRVDSLEEAVQVMEAVQTEGNDKLERIYCVVDAIWEFTIDVNHTPINPLACDETGEDDG